MRFDNARVERTMRLLEAYTANRPELPPGDSDIYLPSLANYLDVTGQADQAGTVVDHMLHRLMAGEEDGNEVATMC